MKSKLVLEDTSVFDGKTIAGTTSVAGEVVFSTGMMGYPESLTDPSYKGQILVLTYPLIGNYGVPEKKYWESGNIQVSGLIVCEYIDTPSHFQNQITLREWFTQENVPLLEIKDTRLLTQKIRDKGSMLGKIIIDKDLDWYDPNAENLVALVSTKEVTIQEPPTGKAKKTILLVDCGAKLNIQRALLKRGVRVITVPWNYDFFTKKIDPFDGIIVSNGPGDPKLVQATIGILQKAMAKKVPTLGICLGHQILTLAAGGNTKKLKYGHRSQNQPCTMEGTKRCYITTQNHGFAVSTMPKGFKAWFTNANDNSNEGIIHDSLPFMSVQFHPEATPGPEDAEWIFDYFLEKTV